MELNNEEIETVLEFPDIGNLEWNINNIELNQKEKLVDIVSKFIENKEILKNTNWLGVSLSGGVDSMVLTSSLLTLRQKLKSFNIVAIHINYNNRNETINEEKFIKNWCIQNNIELIIIQINEFKRATTDRDLYEKETKNIRFNNYKIMSKKYNLNGIFLAHHKGDEQENTFTNIMNGRNLFNISAMDENSLINGVNILRPFINKPKSDIYSLAHKYKIPYFKDTTPDWSNRGKIRRQVFPLLNEIYTNKYLDNLFNISQESKEWNDFINKIVIEPFFNKNIDFKTESVVISNYKEYDNYPSVFWNIILLKISNILKIPLISKKAKRVFYHKLKENFIGECPLNKNIICSFEKEKIILQVKKNDNN